MSLDNCLNFGVHISKKLKKAKRAEARIKELSKTYGLPPALVWQRNMVKKLKKIIRMKYRS